MNGATYPASVTYNGATIEFFREIRLDGPLTSGAIHDVARLVDHVGLPGSRHRPSALVQTARSVFA